MGSRSNREAKDGHDSRRQRRRDRSTASTAACTAAPALPQLIAELGLDPLRVAVERNLEIVPRSTFGEVMVEDGDDYEIVHFVGGG